MKTVTHLALTGLVTTLLATGSAFAGDSEWRSVDNHHGSVTYSPRAKQQEVTIAFSGHRSGRGIGLAQRDNERQQGEFRDVTTPHGTVTYYAPAK